MEVYLTARVKSDGAAPTPVAFVPSAQAAEARRAYATREACPLLDDHIGHELTAPLSTEAAVATRPAAGVCTLVVKPR